MLKHIVIFTWKSATTPDQVEKFGCALDQLAVDLPEVIAMSHGADLRLRDGAGDYALVATFRDLSDWQSYQADPRHKAFVHDFVTPLQESRQTIQFEDVGNAA